MISPQYNHGDYQLAHDPARPSATWSAPDRGWRLGRRIRCRRSGRGKAGRIGLGIAPGGGDRAAHPSSSQPNSGRAGRGNREPLRSSLCGRAGNAWRRRIAETERRRDLGLTVSSAPWTQIADCLRRVKNRKSFRPSAKATPLCRPRRAFHSLSAVVRGGEKRLFSIFASGHGAQGTMSVVRPTHITHRQERSCNEIQIIHRCKFGQEGRRQC